MNNNKPSPSFSLSSVYSTLPTPTPGFVLLFSSLPFTAGAYLGYRKEMKQAAKEASAAASADSSKQSLLERLASNSHDKAKSRRASSKVISSASAESSLAAAAAAEAALVGTPPAIIAARAFVFGSMLSVGGVGLLSAAIFYASGCKSMEELVQSCRDWAPQKRRAVEETIGINNHTTDSASALSHDVNATSGMTEEEELEYIKHKYMPEIYSEDEDNGMEVHVNVNGKGAESEDTSKIMTGVGR